MSDSMVQRIEKDLIGELSIPAQQYYGIQTARALNNFNLSHNKLIHYPVFIKALAMVKLACAQANFKLGFLNPSKYQAIVFACEEIIAGRYHDQFALEMLQGGAGTSTNMNMNEVIANIGLEYLGYTKGQYQFLHPNNDVNMSQSTNDVYPSAIKLALILFCEQLNEPFQTLITGLDQKAEAFKSIIKMGRTQLQDAVPMTLGQEFGAFADTLRKDLQLLRSSTLSGLYQINLGGTAIGTGLNASSEYRVLAVQILADICGKPIQSADNLIEATSDMGDFVLLSGLLKRSATKLTKIANDLRLLSSGPRTGFGEILLEPRQAGSSIMPGKVNPVIPEALNLACFQVMANDLAVTLAADAGQLQLNAMEPLIAFKLFESIEILGNAMQMLQDKCISTLQANPERCLELVENSIGIITALNPYLGYETTTRLAKTAFLQGINILELIQAENLIPADQLQELLSIEQMTQPA
jgi:aspartate ammonia-lyase